MNQKQNKKCKTYHRKQKNNRKNPLSGKTHPPALEDNQKPISEDRHLLTLEEILGAAIPREQALALIHADPDTSRTFSGFPPDGQEKLISFIQGAQGLKITYDSFFKYVMNPDAHPSRLEDFLSAILGEKVKIRMVLPLEGVRMADAGSFVIMDILVELSNGTTVNVEIQKIGYRFPGERASCYLSDFIMRQYNRVKAGRKKRFSFRDLKPVILIVIMEESSPEFAAVRPKYIHRGKTIYDSGAQVTSLSKTIYISLDTFHSVVHNNTDGQEDFPGNGGPCGPLSQDIRKPLTPVRINSKLEAWLTFLSCDHPADIVRLVSAYHEFLPCYRDIMEFRRNPKELIYMYSEALAILDRNTEIFMCEELKKEVESLQKKVTSLQKEAKNLQKEAKNLRFVVSDQNAVLSERNAALSEKDAVLSENATALSQKDAEIALLKKQIAELTSKDNR